jgi:hypothetical protein
MGARVVRAASLAKSLLVLLLVATCSMAHSQSTQRFDPDSYRGTASQLARVACDDFERSSGIAIDASGVDALAAELMNFAGIYWEENNCQELASGSVPGANSSIQSYLSDALVRRKARLPSLYSRLAEACGSSSEASGWPAEASNQFGLLSFVNGPTRLVRYSPTSGNLDLGFAQFGIGFLPGEYQVSEVTKDGAVQQTQKVSISAGQLTTFASRVQAVQIPNLTVVAQLPADQFCLASLPEDKQPQFGYRPSGPARGTVPVPNSPAAFVGSSAAIVSIGAPPGECGERCMDEVALLIARAISGWAGVCRSCRPESLLALQIGRRLFVDPRVLAAINSGRFDLAVAAEAANPLAQNTIASGGGRPFVSLQPNDADHRALCGVVRGEAPAWLAEIRSIACSNSSSNGMRTPARMQFRFVSDSTSCGSAKDFLACGTPDRGIEVTLSDARYAWRNDHSAESVTVGSGASNFDLLYILVHEVGHWMGLADKAEQTSTSTSRMRMMSAIYAAGRACISSGDVSMFAASSDLSWSGRLTACSGLRRPNSGGNR